MNKKTYTILGVIASAIATSIAITLISADQGSQQPNTKPLAALQPSTTSAACKAFTLDDATAILGPGTKVAPGNGGGDASSDLANISDCGYVVGGASNSDPKSVSAAVLVRSAKTAEGAEYNKSIFSTNRPAGKQDVPGVGDTAFWDASLSQLNVLRGDTWYIIGNMKGPQADSGTLETSKAIYDQIKHRL